MKTFFAFTTGGAVGVFVGTFLVSWTFQEEIENGLLRRARKRVAAAEKLAKDNQKNIVTINPEEAK